MSHVPSLHETQRPLSVRVPPTHMLHGEVNVIINKILLYRERVHAHVGACDVTCEIERDQKTERESERMQIRAQ